MKLVAFAFVLFVASASPAAAYDPDAARREIVAPSPPAAQPPPGLYRVTEVYAGDAVTRTGDLTRYETVTRHELTDTFARPLETIATGTRSAFDGLAFNGRAALTDGALVAGTYYQNYVFDGTGYVPVSIVFFQDDAELARRVLGTRPGGPPTAGAPTSVAPSPAPATVVTSRAPSARPIVPPAPPDAPARSLMVVIGVDPSGGTAVLDALEVARGARFALRVNVRGDATLEAWSLLGGTNDAWNAPGWHAAAAPLAALWSRLPPPGTAWTLSLRVRLRPWWGGAAVERDGTIRIAVRSPAVVQ